MPVCIYWLKTNDFQQNNIAISSKYIFWFFKYMFPDLNKLFKLRRSVHGALLRRRPFLNNSTYKIYRYIK